MLCWYAINLSSISKADNTMVLCCFAFFSVLDNRTFSQTVPSFLLQITDRQDNVTDQKSKTGADKTTNGPDTLPSGGHTEGRVTPTVPSAPPITIGQIISLLADAEKLTSIVSINSFCCLFVSDGQMFHPKYKISPFTYKNHITVHYLNAFEKYKTKKIQWFSECPWPANGFKQLFIVLFIHCMRGCFECFFSSFQTL